MTSKHLHAKPEVVKVKISQLHQTLCDNMNCSLPSSSVQRILQARILEWITIPFYRVSSQARNPRSPALQADSLLSVTRGKPKNTRVGSLSFLQWIFLTQESNRGLLNLRQSL